MLFALAAAAAFVLAFVEHAGKLTIHSTVFDQAGLAFLGAALLAVHLALGARRR